MFPHLTVLSSRVRPDFPTFAEWPAGAFQDRETRTQYDSSSVGLQMCAVTVDCGVSLRPLLLAAVSGILIGQQFMTMRFRQWIAQKSSVAVLSKTKSMGPVQETPGAVALMG